MVRVIERFEKSSFREVRIPLYAFFAFVLFIYLFVCLFFTVRLYDTNTGQCFVPANPREYHTGPINMASTD